MIKGIVFDCFGVLIADGLKAHIDAVAQVDPQAAQDLHDLLKQIDRGMTSFEESSEQISQLMSIKEGEFLEKLNETLVRNDELLSFIRTLRPRYKVALLSNVRGRDRLDELFAPEYSLDDFFDVVVASGDVGIIKPEREIYELTAEKIGIAPEDCVMIDDRPDYCEGAETVGMRSILFQNTKQGTEELLALIDSER